MSKEQLFDLLCEHFGEEYDTVETSVFHHLYEYLIYNDVKAFIQYLKTLNNVWERMYVKSKNIEDRINLMYHIFSLLKVMNFINEQTGKEIFKW